MAELSQGSESSFTLFPKAPPEIREMIWIRAAPHRVISISEIPYFHLTNDIYDCLAMLQSNSLPQFKTSTRIPAIFHTCRESRLVALKNYHFIFEGPCKTPFYFNPSTDTVFFNNINILNVLASHFDLQSFVDDLRKIRYLALGSTDPTSLLMTPISGQHFSKFENLESLIIGIGKNFGNLEKFQVRKQLRGHWKKGEKKGGDLGEQTVMQNPDIVFMHTDEMRAMGLIPSV
jgi:hypothetical protein